MATRNRGIAQPSTRCRGRVDRRSTRHAVPRWRLDRSPARASLRRRHLNSYTRFRLALIEDNPTIKPYAEALWAELADARTAPVEPSLSLLDGLHSRWVLLIRSFSEPDFARTFQHPERGEMRLDQNLALYSWHCRHHLAHINGLRERNGW